VYIELPFVEGHGNRVVGECRGAVNQVARGVRNAIDRIVGSMCMELDLDHAVKRFTSRAKGGARIDTARPPRPSTKVSSSGDFVFEGRVNQDRG
jgi:hypothetical protein